MEWVVWIIVVVFALGAGLALYEWRRGKTLLKHDIPHTPQNQSDRWAMRAEGDMAARMGTSHPVDREP